VILLLPLAVGNVAKDAHYEPLAAKLGAAGVYLDRECGSVLSDMNGFELHVAREGLGDLPNDG
jgi:hypothetical protein